MLKAIVFDFDGVLVESVDIKGDAFVTLYENEGANIQKEVLDFHRKNGGVSRFEKIRHYEEDLLGRVTTQKKMEQLATQFGEIVERKVISCPWVSGAEDFLKAYHNHFPLFVASATPEEELRRIVAKRGMSHYFKEVLGTPVKKAEHLANILRKNDWQSGDVVMVGDAITDYEAARINHVNFVGRVPDGKASPFPEGTVVLRDLRQLVGTLGVT